MKYSLGSVVMAIIMSTTTITMSSANAQTSSAPSQNTMDKDIPAGTLNSQSRPINQPMDHPMPGGTDEWTGYLDRMDRNTSIVYFEKGSSNLSALEKSRIRDKVTGMNRDNKLNSVIVASWSDKPYPTKTNETVVKADRDLADRRNANIREVLREAGARTVDTYSMAERPNWLQKAFGTDAAQIKGEARDRKWDATNESRLAAMLDRQGGPSKSVIIMRGSQMDPSLTGGR